MMFWFLAALLTLVVAALLILPLLRSSPSLATSEAEFDRAVYRDQLAELERDEARGIIASSEAAAARNEISRRLLQTEKSAVERPSSQGLTRVARIAILLVPLVALPVYLSRGGGGTPDVPLKERMDSAIANKDMPALLARVEKHLETAPDDLAGWKTLIMPYKAAERWDDAARAYANIIRLSPPSADLYTEYAEALMLASNGDINKDARGALAKALAIEPTNPKAVFFDALGLKQDGKTEEAKQRLTALLDSAPADAPYKDVVMRELASLNQAKAPVLSKDQMQAGAQMSASDRSTMINSMIDGLEQRLGTTSTDIDGWLRLIRARSVNQQADKAKASLATAQVIFKADQKALDSLNSLATELGIAP